MPGFPAFCERCGAIIPEGSGIFVSGSVTNLRLEGNRAGPCPNCGGTLNFPDGVYNVFGDVIELLSGPNRTIADLQRLTAVLRQAQERHASPTEVRAAVEQDVPELKSIADLIPQKRSEFYPFIMMLIAAISLVITAMRSGGQTNNINVDQIINVMIQQEQDATPSTRDAAPFNQSIVPGRHQKVGRNDPCPCGSGPKYKRCHLNQPTPPQQQSAP